MNNVGFYWVCFICLWVITFFCFFLSFQTKCSFSLFRDTGHHLIQNNKIGGINSPVSKPVISKNLKEEKTVKEKDMEARSRPGDVVGCWEGDDFAGFVTFQRLALISHLVNCLSLACVLMQHNGPCFCYCGDHVRIEIFFFRSQRTSFINFWTSSPKWRTWEG